MNKIKAILVDDEESARNILGSLLEKFCPKIELVGKFKNVEDTVEGIKELNPELVFLDIEMPNYAGYEIVRFFDEIPFEMIFVTAYDKYAIKAFEVSATDYLLKPIEIDRLKQAVEKAEEKILLGNRKMRIDHLAETLERKTIKSLIVSERGYQHVVQLNEVIAIEAQESYSCIHTTSKKYIASKNLKHFEKLLVENNNFARVHKSWIVNLDHLINFSRSSLEINLTSGIIAKLSKYKKPDFELLLKSKG